LAASSAAPSYQSVGVILDMGCPSVLRGRKAHLADSRLVAPSAICQSRSSFWGASLPAAFWLTGNLRVPYIY